VKKAEAIKKLLEYDKRGRCVFTNSDLAKIFHQDNERALRAGIKRLQDDGLLTRMINGVYSLLSHKSEGAEIGQTLTVQRQDADDESPWMGLRRVNFCPISAPMPMTIGKFIGQQWCVLIQFSAVERQRYVRANC